MKKQSSQPSKKFSPIKLVILFVAGALLIVLAWNWYVHYQDKQKFMTLKQDMLSLQADFNKIDPGWTYSEWCNAKGEKFKENEASSCGFSIINNNAKQLDNYLDKLQYYFKIKEDSSFVDREGRYQNNRVVRYKNTAFSCEIGSIKNATEEYSNGMSCTSSALDFYFPKNQ